MSKSQTVKVMIAQNSRFAFWCLAIQKSMSWLKWVLRPQIKRPAIESAQQGCLTMLSTVTLILCIIRRRIAYENNGKLRIRCTGFWRWEVKKSMVAERAETPQLLVLPQTLSISNAGLALNCPHLHSRNWLEYDHIWYLVISLNSQLASITPYKFRLFAKRTLATVRWRWMICVQVHVEGAVWHGLVSASFLRWVLSISIHFGRITDWFGAMSGKSVELILLQQFKLAACLKKAWED